MDETRAQALHMAWQLNQKKISPEGLIVRVEALVCFPVRPL